MSCAAVRLNSREDERETMIKVVQALDRMPLAEVGDDEEEALERKLDTAARIFGNRDCWLKPYQRIEILQRLVTLARAAKPGEPYAWRR
jgi:hypothetical protein